MELEEKWQRKKKIRCRDFWLHSDSSFCFVAREFSPRGQVQTHTHTDTHTHAKTFPQTWKSTQQWEFEWVDVGRRTSGCYKRLNLSKLLLPTPLDVPPFHVHVHVDASGSVILFSPSSFSLPTNCQSTNHPHLPPFNHHSFVLCATPRSSLRLPAPPPAHFWQLFGNHFRVWMTRSFSSSRGK